MSSVNTYISHHPKKGRCVIAGRDFSRGDIVLTNEVIPFDYDKMKTSELEPFSMQWNENQDAIALGHITLINHSDAQFNVEIKNDYESKTVSIVASRKIKEGEELLYKYRCPCWFDPV